MIQPSQTADNAPPSDPPHVPRRGLGLLTPARQCRLLRGISERFRQGATVRNRLTQEHQRQIAQLEGELATAQEATTAECRTVRRDTLGAWDQADEQTIASYEQETLQARKSRHHALATIRRQRKRDIAEEEEAFDTQKKQIQAQYAREKPKPSAIQKTEYGQLAAAMRRLNSSLATARELTMQRLGGPDQLAALVPAALVPAALVPAGSVPAGSGGSRESADEVGEGTDDETPGALGRSPLRTEPRSIRECVVEIDALAERAETLLVEMRSGWPARFAESYYLPLLMAGVVLVWCGVIYIAGPERMALWMLVGLPLAVVAGVAAHSFLMIPLRRQTRELHPQLEQTGVDAQAVAMMGRRLSAAKAAVRVAELRRERDEALEALRQQHDQRMREIRERHVAEQTRITEEFDDQIASIQRHFEDRYGEVSRQMAAQATATAAALSRRLDGFASESEERRQTLRTSQSHELHRLRERIDSGVARGLSSLCEAQRTVDRQFPSWETIQQNPHPSDDALRWLPLGRIDVSGRLRESLGGEAPGDANSLPLVLVRETHAAVLIDCPPEQMHVAAELVRGALWRALTSVAGGRVRLTLLDPVGRGQNFASLVSLADHDPQLIGHRVWSASPQITTRLAELTQHVEDVLQTCLRDRYATIEAFNAEAGALAEPYRVVAAIGLPAGLTRDGYDSLRALIDGGRRCGVFLILVRDASQPWPLEMPPLPESSMLQLRIDDNGRLWHGQRDLEMLPIEPADSPPPSAIESLSERIGQASVAAQRVEIPLDSLLPAEEYDSGDSAAGLKIPVGRQGVGRSLEVDLGSGMRQHMLVAGKTGSGKSTLLHALITAAALRYSPDQLHLYLLDFKKGVEFKVYADHQLPHARVIGIESQREFGRSVLERLDAELHQRGELFRAAGVQEVAEYRRQTGKTLPRILLVVDEFQEWFVRDDRVAQECTMLLDRLVRQGRSFGMHVVLSSQSLSGAYSLPRATLGQMAIRIALQCSESDAALILADDNPAARLLSRPGEAIFNDAGGLIEGNQPFQVAWIDPQQHRQRLAALADRHSDAAERFGATVVFEGNRPTRWTPALADQSLSAADNNLAATGLPSGGRSYRGLLGEAVRIGPPSILSLSEAPGRNVLCVADSDSLTSVLTTWLPTIAADVRQQFGHPPEILLLDGQRGAESESLADWLQAAGVECRVVRPRDAEEVLVALSQQIRGTEGGDDGGDDLGDSDAPPHPPTLVVIHSLERFRDLRQDDSFGFSLDGAAAASGGAALQTLLRDGPAAGIHGIISCGSAETLSRWLPRSCHHDLELRIIGRTSAADSAQLIDTPEAADLTPATMLLYDDAGGTIEKFRLCSTPDPSEVRAWGKGR